MIDPGVLIMESWTVTRWRCRTGLDRGIPHILSGTYIHPTIVYHFTPPSLHLPKRKGEGKENETMERARPTARKNEWSYKYVGMMTG